MYKNQKGNKNKKPYGRHNKGNIKGIAKYNETAYFNCPFANPNLKEIKNIKVGNDNLAKKYLNFIKNEYDRIIYFFEKETGIKVSNSFAREILLSYIHNEGWKMYDSNFFNLSFMLFYYIESKPLFGRKINVNSKLYKAIEENCKHIELNLISPCYAKINSKDGTFIDLDFRIVNHKYNTKKEHLYDTFNMKVSYNNKEILIQEIIVDYEYFSNLINLPKETTYRRKELLEIAEEIINRVDFMK